MKSFNEYEAEIIATFTALSWKEQCAASIHSLREQYPKHFATHFHSLQQAEDVLREALRQLQ